jgi:hypothetical protein
VFGVQARFLRSAVRVEGASTGYVRAGDAGSRITYHFCPHCGATVYYELDSSPEHVAVPVGAFADSEFPVPSRSVYEHRMHGWVRIPPALEHKA